MAHRVTVDFYKFCLIAFLIFINGFPIKGVTEPQSDGSKAPSVKECRAHIEAALEQYWETSEEDKKTDPGSTPLTSQSAESLVREIDVPESDDETDQDDDDIDPPVDVQLKDETQDGEDDNGDDDDDEEEDDEEESEDDSKQEQTPDNELDTDEDDEEDDEDDEADEEDDDEEDEEVETADAEASPGEEPDDDEDDDEDEEDEEEEEDQEEKTDALKETGEDKDDEDDEDEEDEDEEDEKTEVSEEENDKKSIKSEDMSDKQDAEDEDEDEDEDDEENGGADEEDDEENGEADEEDDEENGEADEEKGEIDDDDEEEEEEEDEEEEGEGNGEEKNETKEEIEEKDEEDEDEEEEEEEDEADEEETKEEMEEEDEDEEEEEAVEKEVEEVEDEEAEEEDDEEVEDEEEADEEAKEEEVEDEDDEEDDDEEHSEEVKSTEDSLKKDTRGDKVTGETHSAPVGMAPELSETRPASDQPKASPVEEKTPLETVSKETEEEEDEDEEGDDDDDDDDGEEETDETAQANEEEDDDDDDDDSIENIYEEEDDDEHLVVKPGETLRSRDHVDAILGLDDIGTDYDLEEDKLAQSIFKEIKKIHGTSVKPMEMLYKYAESTTRILGDAEIFSKPMILFLGPWSSGKTTILNYLLGLERTPAALKTGTGITDLDFTVISYGEERRITSGTALAADWTYSGVQKFGQGLLDHFKGITIPHTLLKKITLVDTPGIIESRKNDERGYPFNDAFQWFIDRADAIYVVLDPTKVDIGAELGSVLDQLKGREVRFILNKADTIRRSDLMRVVGQLFWNLSPLMSSTEAPVIYAVSLTTKPFHPSAPAKFLADQENNFLYDLRETMDMYVENRIRYARRHAVRVRNHCKMVDCYLATYYRHKSIFSSKKNVATLITENPVEYNIYEGLSSMTNVSRYDLPDPVAYKSFFKIHPLYDFKPLVSTCSYFRGCPMDKLDIAISSELPELLAKYKKAKLAIPSPVKQEGR